MLGGAVFIGAPAGTAPFAVDCGATVGDVLSRPAGQHDHTGADLHTAVEILDVLVDQTNASRRYERADGRGLIGAVNTIQRLAEIERACAERIARSARHEPRQIRLPIDHFRRRMPIRPFRHSADPLGTVPGESIAADADAVAQSLSTTERPDRDKCSRYR